MPSQILYNHPQDIEIALWHITESEEDLLSQGEGLVKQEEFLQIKKPEQRKEWLASRLLVAKLAAHQQLTYRGITKDVFNKPSLVGLTQELSLSHTKNLAAVSISHGPRVGIDAEYLSPRIARIAHKFLHDQELAQADGYWRELLIYWCAKEALYKLYGKKGLLFKEQIRVYRNNDDQQFVGHIHVGNETIQAQMYMQTTPKHLIISAVEQP